MKDAINMHTCSYQDIILILLTSIPSNFGFPTH